MVKARILDQPHDFKHLGINPNKIELWEESRRETSEPGHNEVWYFDGTMVDGSKFIVGLRPKNPYKNNSDSDEPNLNIIITTPTGEEKSDFLYYSPEESFIGEETGCDLKFGPHSVKGNFKSYDLNIEPVNGIGLNLHYEAMTEPFRQGTGIVHFENQNNKYYHTDLSVPKSSITGTLYYDGQYHNVSGFGYHDHQWMNTNPIFLYHHWLWGRMYTEKYTVYIYDFVTSEKYNYQKIPMFGLFDNHTGKLVFETDGNFALDTILEEQKEAGREFPKVSNYKFTNDDGKQVELSIKWNQEIEVRNMYRNAPEDTKKLFDKMNIAPIYIRYYATGDVKYTDKSSGEFENSVGDMIYEYAYFGKPNPNAASNLPKRRYLLMYKIEMMQYKILKKDHNKMVELMKKALAYQKSNPDLIKYSLSRTWFKQDPENPNQEIWMMIDEFKDHNKYKETMKSAEENDIAYYYQCKFMDLVIKENAPLEHEVWEQIDDLQVNLESPD